MRRAVLILAALALAAPAAAQDGSEGSVQRTPESAQKFLGEYFQRDAQDTNLQLEKDADRGFTMRKADGSTRAVSWFSGQMRDWIALEACRSRIVYSDLRAVNKGEFYDLAPFEWSYDLDWSKVTEVVRRSERYFFRSSDAPWHERPAKILLGLAVKGEAGPLVYLDTTEDADRIQFAFAFLKEKCAFKSDTGF